MIVRVCAVSTLLVLASTTAASAHHSVAANFDAAQAVEVTGEVVEWRFRNPHAFLVLDGTATINGVRDAAPQRWEIESSAAASMRAMGIDETSFVPGQTVTIKGIPHRDPSLRRINAFANPASFLAEDGSPIGQGGFLPQDAGPASVVAAKGEGVERLEGLWRPPFQPNPPTTPLALTEAGRQAWEAYDQRLSPANTCEPMSVPDIYNAPSYVVTIEIEDDRAVVRNQAYNVTRTVPLTGESAPADPAGVFGVVGGRIDGDALVIESRDYPASAWGLGAATQIIGAGADMPSSERKTVVERFSVGEDGLALIYEYTVEDPVYLAEPFSHRVEMARLPDDAPVFPYDCDVESASQFSRE